MPIYECLLHFNVYVVIFRLFRPIINFEKRGNTCTIIPQMDRLYGVCNKKYIIIANHMFRSQTSKLIFTTIDRVVNIEIII